MRTNPAPIRKPLFAVVVRAYGGPKPNDTIAAARLTKQAAEEAAEALYDVPGAVASVRRMNWRLVSQEAAHA